MSFRFDWSTVASKELLRDIRTRINTVLYRVASRDNYQGNTMHLLSLDLGTEEPEIKLLDINELSEEKVKMSFGFCYDGNATLKFRATVQLNPLVSNKRLGERGRSHMGVCCSHYSYPVSIFLVLSQFRLEGKVVISYVNPNFHKQKAEHQALLDAEHTNTTATTTTTTTAAPIASTAAALNSTSGHSESPLPLSSREPVEVEHVDPYSKTTAYNYSNTQDEREDSGKPTTAYCEIAIKNEAFKSVSVRSSFDGCESAEQRVQSKVDDKMTRAFKFLHHNPIRFAIKPPNNGAPTAATANTTANTTVNATANTTSAASGNTTANPTAPAAAGETKQPAGVVIGSPLPLAPAAAVTAASAVTLPVSPAVVYHTAAYAPPHPQLQMHQFPPQMYPPVTPAPAAPYPTYSLPPMVYAPAHHSQQFPPTASTATAASAYPHYTHHSPYAVAPRAAAVPIPAPAPAPAMPRRLSGGSASGVSASSSSNSSASHGSGARFANGSGSRLSSGSGSARNSASNIASSAIIESPEGAAAGLQVTSQVATRTGTVTHYSFAAAPTDGDGDGDADADAAVAGAAAASSYPMPTHEDLAAEFAHSDSAPPYGIPMPLAMAIDAQSAIDAADAYLDADHRAFYAHQQPQPHHAHAQTTP